MTRFTANHTERSLLGLPDVMIGVAVCNCRFQLILELNTRVKVCLGDLDNKRRMGKISFYIFS